MSQRTVLRPHTVVAAGDMSAASVTSAVTITQSLSMINYAASWTGTSPVGTIAVQGSDDYQVSQDGQNVLNAGTWNTLPLLSSGALVTTVPVSGNTGNGMIDIDGIAAYALRLVYTKVSGTGTLVVTVTGKVS